jgi:hypothetical protein
MLGGILATCFSIFGLLLVIIGAFAAFTSTSALIDTDNKKIKYSDNLFGIVPVGKWIDIKPDMKMGLKKSHRGYVGYIRGIQPVGIHYNDIRIVLYDSDNKQIMPIKRFESWETSKNDLLNLSSQLGLPVI